MNLQEDLILRLTSDNVALTAQVGDLQYKLLKLKEKSRKLELELMSFMMDNEYLKKQNDALITENDDLQGQLQDI